MKAAALCLALTMYREARAEPISTQIAVGKILQNRAVIEKTTPCKALESAYQFAWVRKYKVITPKANGTIDDCVWQQTKRIANDLKKLHVKGITPNHVFFNAKKLGVRFKTHNTPIILGNLIFY